MMMLIERSTTGHVKSIFIDAAVIELIVVSMATSALWRLFSCGKIIIFVGGTDSIIIRWWLFAEMTSDLMLLALMLLRWRALCFLLFLIMMPTKLLEN